MVLCGIFGRFNLFYILWRSRRCHSISSIKGISSTSSSYKSVSSITLTLRSIPADVLVQTHPACLTAFTSLLLRQRQCPHMCCSSVHVWCVWGFTVSQWTQHHESAQRADGSSSSSAGCRWFPLQMQINMWVLRGSYTLLHGSLPLVWNHCYLSVLEERLYWERSFSFTVQKWSFSFSFKQIILNTRMHWLNDVLSSCFTVV